MMLTAIKGNLFIYAVSQSCPFQSHCLHGTLISRSTPLSTRVDASSSSVFAFAERVHVAVQCASQCPENGGVVEEWRGGKGCDSDDEGDDADEISRDDESPVRRGEVLLEIGEPEKVAEGVCQVARQQRPRSNEKQRGECPEQVRVAKLDDCEAAVSKREACRYGLGAGVPLL